MTLSRTEEIRQVASEWEFDKRIPAPRAARLLKELLRRVDELERGIGQMRLIAGLPLPPDVAEKVAEADRLRKLFDDAGEGLCDDAQTLSERERDAMQNAILHMSEALNVDAPKGKNCADGWVLLARAVLSKVREMAVAVTP